MVALSGIRAGVPWRLSPALLDLLAQVDALAPARSTRSDGTIGDPAHAARTSRHNPLAGVVHALDVTHDPAGGLDAHALAEQLLAEQDPRLRLVISRGRIGSGPAGPAPGTWRDYDGDNPHAVHIHIEVLPGSTAGLWTITTKEDPMSVADARTALHGLIDEAANRSTPTGRQLADDLEALIGGAVTRTLHRLADEAANRSTPTGRQIRDDLDAITASTPKQTRDAGEANLAVVGVVAGTVVILGMLAALVGIELAGRNADAVLYLLSAVLVPTGVSIVNTVLTQRASRKVDQVAAKVTQVEANTNGTMTRLLDNAGVPPASADNG